MAAAERARALRVFVEKDAAERKRLAERAAAGDEIDLPKGVPVELLSGVTHEDCAAFATDFGTLLDVEDVVPGAEYTLEVSSPGLERRLTRAEEFQRFAREPDEGEDVYAGEREPAVDGTVDGICETAC